MRKLERTPAPACLGHYRHGANNWNDVTSEHKAEIWQQLEAMQGRFCAYCERNIRCKPYDSHIEHFLRRANVPQKTFDWDNLFGSCNSKSTCGNHKDNKARHINPEQVCKPDMMDPADFLQFLPDGSVQPKPGIEANQQQIAENTIAVFNLNADPSLRGRRRAAYETEKGLASELLEWLDLLPDEPDLEEKHKQNINRILQQEFSAARHIAWLGV